MTLTLDLTPTQVRQLKDEAESRGMDTAGYAKARLFEGTILSGTPEEALAPIGPLPPTNGTGADLVAYWKREGLIGTRPDIKDSQAHARAIRYKAERRDHG